MLLPKDENNVIDPNTAELSIIPDYDYSAADFCTPEPYEKLYELHKTPFLYEIAKVKMEENAKAVGFKSFKGMLQKYNKAQLDAKRRNLVPNQTEFADQLMELNCGTWEATDWGIFRDLPNGGRECACAHPIAPVSRLVNIDTGEVKLTLWFKRSGSDKKAYTTIVDKSTISTARNITSLSSQGISVTSNSASALVDYINDMENLNYDIIPEQKSIGRLGYIPGEGFSPYVDGLVFDGDASFRNLYQSVESKGNQGVWYETAMECRRQSLTARIMLAASFASPILSLVGSLPFFVHLWGVDSGTGKTVALMLAASVWGNPALGSYVQTFNGTQVGQERTAAFLNHLPVCLDELQLTKDSRGKTNFDVQEASFTALANEELCKPLVTGTVVDVNEITTALTGDDQVFIRYHSDALCTIIPEAQYNAAIQELRINGEVIDGSSLEILSVEQTQVQFAAKDSRGYETVIEEPITLIPYTHLTSTPQVERDDPTSGNATLRYTGLCFSGSFGAAQNDLTFEYKIDSGEFLPAEIEYSVEDGRYTAEVKLSGLDYRKVFNITARVSDRLETVEKKLTLKKGIPVFDWGEEDFAFHVPVQMDGDLNVDGTLEVGGKSLLDLFYPVGTVYMTVSTSDPTDLFGGTWEQLQSDNEAVLQWKRTG